MSSTLAAPPLFGQVTPSAAVPSLVRLDEMRDEALTYCRNLARANMAPYLHRRNQEWDEAGWNAMALTRRFFAVIRNDERHGFASTYEDRTSHSIHLGDLQLEAARVGQGTGGLVMQQIARDARRQGMAAITLNVFYDNPALRLYERHGFEQIHFDGNKIRMRKIL